MGVISKTVIVKPIGKSIKYYKELGYNAIHNTPLEVNIYDLQKHSNVNVVCFCDICGKQKTMTFDAYNRLIENDPDGLYYCKSCAREKVAKVCISKYGVDNPFKLKIFQEKARETINRHRMEDENYDKKVIEKRRITVNNKYGVDYIMQSPEAQEKSRLSMLEHFGVEYPSQSPEIVKKIVASNIKNLGVERPAQSSQIKKKMSESLCKNKKVATSKQQMYLHSLYGGELNGVVSYYNCDIVFREDRMICEYNGGGHDLCVKLGDLSQEDFQKRMIVREKSIVNDGYRIFTIVSKSDKLPSDDILLQMLGISKQYFEDFPEHHWIEWYIDEGIYKNAEHPEGCLFYYGNLRNIKAA